MPRTPPHFKLSASIKNHRRCNGLYEDKRLLGIYVSIGIECVERFGDRTGDSFLITGTGLCGVTGCKRVSSALVWMRKLAETSPVSIRKQGQMWLVRFPNFAKKQGFQPKNGASIEKKGRVMGDSSSASSSATKRRKNKNERRAQAPDPPEDDPFERDSPEGEFCQRFDQALSAIHGNVYESPAGKTRRTWVKQARLLINHVGEPEAQRVCSWLFDEAGGNPDAAFWRGTIFCVPKFRKRFTTLAVQSKRAPPAATRAEARAEEQRATIRLVHEQRRARYQA